MGELLARRGDGVLELTLNRPEKMNALSASLVDALHAELDAADADGTRLVVFRGEGKNLSAGFDFGGYDAQSDGDLVLRFLRIEQLLQRVFHARYDTLAFAHGRNFGAGVDLFAVCNRRVATPDASFRMPGLGFGLVLGSRRFAGLVGESWARLVLQEGITFAGVEAHARGFVTALADQAGWASERERADTARRSLGDDATTRLFRVTHTDTRAADMAELVASAARPGLQGRLRAYREALGK
ncbi:enoyl-CoA hydratase/isomerase family protein [Luteibacter sp. SG786]|uniref:enoyl-CoA hydratase/isomerase family protein n=1 Tax=Luteibacter sp. SG786 TaxID=2587130 RepID=UPI00141EE3B9|nr:enoyl-CoA hydratase/isomerase family protein [Luteibacter sp. SG786]NII54075.1 enoyl-CoA hydratase/carnithine racemase [Luteibacter sp. SG786]